MSISVTYGAILTVAETLAAAQVPDAAETKRLVTHALWNTSKVLGAGTSPPATLTAGFVKALAAGVATIDLTALVGTNGIAVDGTGLRVQALRVLNPATNANPITIGKGAANGYDGFGAAFSLALPPGAEALILTNDAGGDIAGGNKNLDLAGTLIQALDVLILLG